MKTKYNNTFKNILPYFKDKQFSLLFIFNLLCLLISSLASLITPKVSSSMIDQLGNENFFNKNLYIGLSVLLLFNIVFPYLQTYTSTLLGEKVGQDLRNKLVKKVLKQDYPFIQKNKSSKILTTIVSDTNFVKDTFFTAVTTIVTSVLMMTGSVFAMFSIYPKLALPIIIIFPILAAVLIVFAKSKMPIFQKSQKARDSLNRIINENIKGSMLIRVFVSEKTEKLKFKKANTHSKEIGIQVFQIMSVLIPMINATNLIASMFIVSIGGKSAIEGTLTIGELSAFSSYVTLFGTPMIMIGFLSTALGQAIASLKRINKILDSEETFENGTKNLSTIENIDIKNLSKEFNGKKVLNNVSLNVEKGEKIGIIGMIGSGKSTLLHHLIRIYDPSSGSVEINGTDIKNYNISSIREKVGFCFQENFLVDGTIKYNITFGRKIKKNDLNKAIKCAGVADILKSKDLGMLSKVGERGSNLSGGQKQRIMLARALAGNPQVLILDNAISRLDITTERKVFENIRKNYSDITIIIVAQKISSIRDCDRIYVMDKGSIESHGNHNSLLSTSPIYKEIELTQKNYKHET